MYDNVVHCQIKYIRLEAPCVRGQSLMRRDSCKGWPAMDILQNFRRNAGAPYEAARSWKQTGNKPVMAYFCSYTPEEILYAAGVFPLRIFGTSTHISHADAHLQSYSCSLVRGALEDALSGQLSFLDGVVFPHTCDSIQRLSDIWRLNVPMRLHADIVLPVKLDSDTSRAYMVDVLRKFRSDLEASLSVTISDDDLRRSIRLYNRIRSAMKKIYTLKDKNPALIGGSDMRAVMKSSMTMDRAVVADMLEELARDLENGSGAAMPKSGKRLVLSGSLCDHPDVYAIIEKSGGFVVWDDLCNGSRYFEGMLRETGDPIEAIAQRYSERIICPAKHMALTSRGDNLVRIVKEHNAAGVLFLLLKFCDPHAFDYPYIKEMLDNEKIPSMLMEMEQVLPSEGQLKTRFEAFIEMLQ